MMAHDLEVPSTARTARRHGNRAGCRLWLCLALAAAAPVLGSDGGVVTILEGPGSLLRGPRWFKLARGGSVQEGDLIELKERGPAQVEFDRILLNLTGPGELYVASLASGDGRPGGSTEIYLPAGWLKLAAKSPRGGLRLRTDLGTVNLQEATVVIESRRGLLSFFVESGTGQLLPPDRRGEAAPARELRAGEFWSLAEGRPPAPAPRPPPEFLSGMPSQFMDPLPALAGSSGDGRSVLAPGDGIHYSEARAWLAGPYRKAFLHRLRPRLQDPAFRGGVEAEIGQWPEWDRILHPEKYQPRRTATP